jgi:hypothetical protein
MTDDIKWIKAHPGRYVLSADPAIRLYLNVETDEQGNVHQLNPKMQRDGILRDEGWEEHKQDIRAYKVGKDETSGLPTFTRVLLLDVVK